MADLTIVFIDLTGSSGIFQAHGNAKATEMVTITTQWIGKTCKLHQGRVLKYLGDGVLISFVDNQAAVKAVVEIQRLHFERLRKQPENLKMQLKIGLARGEALEKEGDIFGDVVNIASRLSDLAGPDQILSTHSVIVKLTPDHDFSYRNLGPMDLRGRTESLPVYRIEWQRDYTTEFMTIPPRNTVLNAQTGKPDSTLELSQQQARLSFQMDDFPVYLGRVGDAKFVVNDPRVSRLHARIDYRGSTCFLEDVSSYGTWVRFSDSSAVISLRRQECVLHGKGEIALGAPFGSVNPPIIRFQFKS